jgi:hypothetical protein
MTSHPTRETLIRDPHWRAAGFRPDDLAPRQRRLSVTGRAEAAAHGHPLAHGEVVSGGGSLILLAPPLIVRPEQIDEGVAKLDRVLSWVDAVELAG